ncbi:golgin subfamily B member 1-like [Ostrinia nubilalis]|uniref:golgin subfamily B member 1-like n=1 Tax=Ostrinia nubilalis TaxID=29057 RepID=UPI0030824136
MADDQKVDKSLEGEPLDDVDTNIAVSSSDVCSVAGSVKNPKTQRMSSSSDRQVKFERAQKALENAALVSKRIKEHRKATAELLGRPFEEDDIGDSAEMASTMSERTGYSVATDTSTNISVQDALNIPGISESLANTLKQKEILMERIKQYKEISKRPIKTSAIKKDPIKDSKVDVKKITDNSDITQLLNTLKDKENALSVIQVKMKAMETTILDLQEKLNEKDQIIEAKNMATTLMSDSLSKKEKDSLLLLEDTRHQMTKMQENFISMETEWKDERQKLIKEIELKDEKIHSLEEANTILENSRFEITVAHSKLLEELELKNKEISQLEESIKKLSVDQPPEVSPKEKEDFEEEKGSIEISQMVELSKKVELLEQINCQIRQTNIELENKLATVNTETKAAVGSPSKKASPLPGRKGGRNTASKAKSPWSNMSSESLQQESEKKGNKNEITKLEMLVQSLNKDILEKEYLISQKDVCISELQSVKTLQENTIQELKMTQNVPTAEKVDMGIETDPLESLVDNDIVKVKDADEKDSSTEDQKLDVTELEEKLKAAQQQIAALNEEVDLANKNMIKVKSSHKLKIKQMQKTIDNFSKVSDSNAEIVKLNEEMHQLTQKVAELEEEKGNLQLHLVDYDSGRLTESDVYKKMIEMENLAETRLRAISVLESQKFDLVQELHVLQQKNMEMEDKLADISQLQSEQVCSEIKSVQLEEQIDELTASRRELELIIDNLKLDKEHLNSTIKIIQEEKDELTHKLESYIQENMELTDKLEKLSTEKVSSAESIEIVESLTTQEKLELEEYNKGIMESKSDPNEDLYKKSDDEQNIQNLVEQAAELNKKIDLFNQEREEVMDKMSKINSENEMLHDEIAKLNRQCSNLQSNIDLLTNEKHDLLSLNADLSHQIEDLKREHLEIVKETVEVPKPSVIEETLEAAVDVQQDDKVSGEKGVNRNKSVKQLTKEILKLKNIIKDREAEIGDCQMKILSLEEQHQKQNELLQTNASFEAKLKSLSEENQALRDKLEDSVSDKQFEKQLEELKNANEMLQDDILKTRQEYSNTITARDVRIHELENLLREYEMQILNYGNTLQQKDKELVEYINQITKLNDVSQKLKSTIELLEEEKAKDQNAELVKSLNKQISAYQKKLTEVEDKIKSLEEEKSQLMSIKVSLEGKNNNIETELKKHQDLLSEKQTQIKELQTQQQKHSEEVANVMLQAKERDEEIHEIKLQLRKESIENEKLRNLLAEKDKSSEEYSQAMQDTSDKMQKLLTEKEQLSEQCVALEVKNKELMEKLKKFAVNIKKKSSMYTDLENQFHQVQHQLEAKNEHMEQLLIQVETLPALQEKLKHAEEEINRLQIQRVSYEQQLREARQEVVDLNSGIILTTNHLTDMQEKNFTLESQVVMSNQKAVALEIELKNNANLVTKVSTLEADNNYKQAQIVDLLNKLGNQEQILTQLQFGHDAKIQERDLYIETLETEMNKYKTRICRLEESISIMEDRRHSLERKADQLDSQLQEKQKAYTDYSSQEDELVSRLAVLMDHDRVVEKQLHEIESENRHLQDKLQYLTEENKHLRKSLSEVQDNYNTIIDKANRTDVAENTIIKLQNQVRDLEAQLKRITQEHQAIILKKKQDIEDLETEFTTQIDNAIKEKKMYSEKYEKITEHITQLEIKLQEYSSENERLKINMEELNRINQDILDKSDLQQQQAAPDYTDQYITEINRLNALVNNKNQEIQEVNNKLHSVQVNGASTVSNLESKINDLTNKLQQSTSDVDQLINEIQILKQDNEQLQHLILQKEEQYKELKDRKKVSFEMNIPKTEGLIISSTIEAVNTEEPAKYNISDLESQIVSDVSSNYSDTKPSDSKTTDSVQKSAFVAGSDVLDSKNVSEEVIVPKKAYLCYKAEQDDNPSEVDPFNSDEGWGFGETEEVPTDVSSEYAHLNEKISQLQKENETLKKDLDANNTKLLKVMKKLKEFKNNNDMLSNELKLSKQLSQSSFLDSAIEDELRNTIMELEKKLGELNSDLQKEKREKETIKKQNEVFSNANERLTDMKEKLDSEIELWKFKFKEVNDKMSTLQWGENKNTPEHKISSSHDATTDSVKNEMIKLEKENDELQTMVDQLTSQNRELLTRESKLRSEIDVITQKMKQQQSCPNCDSLNASISELSEKNTELQKHSETINKKLKEFEVQSNEATKMYENLKLERDEINQLYENSKSELLKKCNEFESEIQSLKGSENEAKVNAESLKLELERTREQLLMYEEQPAKVQNEDLLILSEKNNALEEYCSQLKCQLDESSNKVTKLETLNQEMAQTIQSYENKNASRVEENYHIEINNKNLEQKVQQYAKQITELTLRLQNLNIENDQLLSSLAELRSSMSSAVDQRGFEIAELWKQHLAQREADFLKVEQELRAELSASETKYEQLLDNVQSFSQEETNKLVMMEQVTSLQNKLQDKEGHLHSLQEKYCEVMNQLELLRSEIEDEKVMYENKLLSQQEEYEKLIQEKEETNKRHTENYEQKYQNAQNDLATFKANNEELCQQVDELNRKLEEVASTIVDLNNQIRLKDSEIYQKTHEYTLTLTQRNEEFENVRKQLLEFEKKIEDLSYEKESELAILRLKMHENIEYYEKNINDLNTDKSNLEEALNAKLIECTNLNKLIVDLNKSLEEHSSRIKEMQVALENQELEIVTLKDELNTLENMMRKASTRVEKHVTFASDTKSSDEGESQEGLVNKELLDAVPRAELDLALYMLHQRDVRCEELTMELTQLLEERDTLQLRLSDSLRSNEEMKSKIKSIELDTSTDSQETVSELPSFSVEREHSQFVDTHRGQTSRSSSVSEADGDKPKLQAKLSELRSVKHSRDVRFRQESEQRQMDLRLLQRDVAHLPPEARDQLAQAHHTLSRDSQSTSTVLLNWLRGKSTPKVMHM